MEDIITARRDALRTFHDQVMDYYIAAEKLCRDLVCGELTVNEGYQGALDDLLEQCLCDEDEKQFDWHIRWCRRAFAVDAPAGTILPGGHASYASYHEHAYGAASFFHGALSYPEFHEIGDVESFCENTWDTFGDSGEIQARLHKEAAIAEIEMEKHQSADASTGGANVSLKSTPAVVGESLLARVRFKAPPCPKCGSRVGVASTRDRVRHLKCTKSDCGWTIKKIRSHESM